MVGRCQRDLLLSVAMNAIHGALLPQNTARVLYSAVCKPPTFLRTLLPSTQAILEYRTASPPSPAPHVRRCCRKLQPKLTPSRCPHPGDGKIQRLQPRLRRRLAPASGVLAAPRGFQTPANAVRTASQARKKPFSGEHAREYNDHIFRPLLRLGVGLGRLARARGREGRGAEGGPDGVLHVAAHRLFLPRRGICR